MTLEFLILGASIGVLGLQLWQHRRLKRQIVAATEAFQNTHLRAGKTADTLFSEAGKTLDAAIAEKVSSGFDEVLTRRIKAEVGKWVFVGGGGGTLAAVQYCVLCAQGVSRWRMVPDMGPVCEVCCETRLTEPN